MSLAKMAKAELHVHLEGSIRPETLREIDPTVTLEEIREASAHADFEGFIRSFIWVNRKLVSPESYAIAARRLFEELASQSVVYAEVILSAGVVVEEAARAALEVRWILDATRQWGAHAAIPVFEFAASRLGDGVVGIGIGGIEEKGPATWFKTHYEVARAKGLRLTCHAGETTGPQSVWDALAIGAERIGHGIRAIEDPLLVEHLRVHSIPLEVCITSNVRTGAVASLAEHPVRRLYDAGVPLVLNTDDPALFECTLNGEYSVAAAEFGFTEAELKGLVENGFRYAFNWTGSR